jgi:hypothetical protein
MHCSPHRSIFVTALIASITVLGLAGCVGIQYDSLSSKEDERVYFQARQSWIKAQSGERGVGFKAKQMASTKAFARKYPTSCSTFSEGIACSAYVLAETKNLTPNSKIVLLLSFLEFETGGRCSASGQFDPNLVLSNAEKYIGNPPPQILHSRVTYIGPDRWTSEGDYASETFIRGMGIYRYGTSFVSNQYPGDQEVFHSFVDHEKFKDLCVNLKKRAR